jgi:hypothetical protein
VNFQRKRFFAVAAKIPFLSMSIFLAILSVSIVRLDSTQAVKIIGIVIFVVRC